MRAMDIFDTVDVAEKINVVVNFLKANNSFCELIKEKYGNLEFKVGDLCFYKASDNAKGFIMQVVGVSEGYYDLICRFNYCDDMTSNAVCFPSREFKRDWEEHFIGKVKADHLSEIPSFIYKHFYHDTFVDGRIKKKISTVIDFDELEIEHCKKIIKIPFCVKDVDDVKNTTPQINFEDIGIKSTEYETVFEEK